MGFALIMDWQFAIMVAIGGGATNFIYKAAYKKTKGSSIALTQDSHIFHGLIIQYISHFKYLRATAHVEKFYNKLEKCIDDIEINRKTIGKLGAILGSLREPLMISIICLIIIVQVSLLKGQLGSVLISLLFFYRALQSLMMLQNSWNQFLANSGSIQALMHFDKENKNNREKSGAEEFFKKPKLITLKNMSFNYDKKEVLTDINLTINQNETVAIIGESGSGKTTLMNVLAGLLPPDSGEVLIYDKNIRKIDIRKYQRSIGYITQDSVIFSDSIFNNVSFWDDPSDTNKLRCQNALKQAALLNFVMSLPEKEDTLLGNNGINLSGGQKQRISIARELYKDIDILFMDEATSSLDSETEHVIQESIKKLKGHYTLLIVAHRLSTIKHADTIVILEHGKIIDMGNYKELFNRNAEFKKMIALQQL
jgi:subfamily B ATP-binding cassette protein MsbA